MTFEPPLDLEMQQSLGNQLIPAVVIELAAGDHAVGAHWRASPSIAIQAIASGLRAIHAVSIDDFPARVDHRHIGVHNRGKLHALTIEQVDGVGEKVATAKSHNLTIIDFPWNSPAFHFGTCCAIDKNLLIRGHPPHQIFIPTHHRDARPLQEPVQYRNSI